MKHLGEKEFFTCRRRDDSLQWFQRECAGDGAKVEKNRSVEQRLRCWQPYPLGKKLLRFLDRFTPTGRHEPAGTGWKPSLDQAVNHASGKFRKVRSRIGRRVVVNQCIVLIRQQRLLEPPFGAEYDPSILPGRRAESSWASSARRLTNASLRLEMIWPICAAPRPL